MSTVTGALSSGLSTLAYPRTGKRGVPQQFARRLHEMIESEAKVALVYPDQSIISWSKSGLAFRIIDVEGFTSTVLPKYFRTKKFSSFQRNLNLVSKLCFPYQPPFILCVTICITCQLVE